MPTQRSAYLIALFPIILCLCAAWFFFYQPQQDEEILFDAKSSLIHIMDSSQTTPLLSLETNVTNIMNVYGIKAGFEIVDEAERQEVISNDGCHILLHYVGHAAYAQYPREYDRLTSIVEGTSCIGGFIHGVEAEIFLTSEDPRQDLWDFCSFSIENKVVPGLCYHGVGHAATEHYNYDIPKSLAQCDALAGGPEPDLSNCYRGVFSELGNAVLGVDGHTGMSIDALTHTELDTSDPFSYCESLDTKYQSSCISQLVKVAFKDKPLEEWFTGCADTHHSWNTKKICANIVSSTFVRQTLSFNETTSIPDLVSTYPTELQEIVVLGSLEAFAGYFQDGLQKDWESFCGSFESPNTKAFCSVVFSDYQNGVAAPWMERDDIR